MRNLIILLLCLFSLSASFAQNENIPTLTGKCNISQTGSGSGYWQVSGTFTDESGYSDASSIDVGDILFFTDAGIGFFLPVTSIQSLTPPSFVIRVGNTGIASIVAVPTTLGAIYHPTDNYQLGPFVSGITNADQQTLAEYNRQNIDTGIANAEEITDFGGGTNVKPSSDPALHIGQSWRNGAGQIYRANLSGTEWITSSEFDSLYVDGFDLKLRSQNGSDLMVSVFDIAPVQQISATTDIQNVTYPFGINVLTIAQQGATNGQVLKWNTAHHKWEPGTDNTGGGGGGGVTDLDYIPLPTSGEVTSSTGMSAVLTLVTDTTAGLMDTASFIKIKNIIVTDTVYLDSLALLSHDPVTVTDNSMINFTLTGQDITANLIDNTVTGAKLATSGVSSGTYGDATNVGQFTVSNKGQIVSASDVPITFPDTSPTNEGSLTVGAGTVSTSLINSNTSGSTPITLFAGTGVSLSEVSNTILITNNAPDQIVGLTGAGITAVTGTYPTFTITSTEVDGSTTNELQTLYEEDHDGSTIEIGLLPLGNTYVIPSATTSLSGLLTASDKTKLNTITGTNTGDQTLANTSTSTEHLVTLSATGGSVKLVEGSGIALATTGTTADGVVTISSTSAGTTNLSVSGTSSPLTLNSDTGTDVTVTAGTGVSLTGTSGNITINNTGVVTEVDGSITNEGSLSVAAGTSTTSLIHSNTSGSTDVTLNASTGLSISEVTGTGNITLTNSAPDQTVALTGAGITAITGTYPNFTITSTEVDGSVSNEGTLGVGAGGATSSTILSTTSGSTGVTVNAAGILAITESTSSNGGSITLTATEVDGSTTNEVQTIANTSNATTHTATLSLTGGSLQLAEGTGVSLTTTGTTADGIVTIANTGIVTEVDGSVTNEGDLTVTAGSSTTSVIHSNTSGSTDVTLTAAGILSTSEAGNVITLTATEVDGSTTNEIQTISGSGASSPYAIDLSLSGGSVGIIQGTNSTITRSGNNFTFNASTQTGTTNLAVTGTSSPLTLTSDTGTDVTVTAGSGISLTGTSGDITIANTGIITEVDGSVTNEGALTVLGGTGVTSLIHSNTSGTTDITLTAGSGINLTENTGTNTITIANAGVISVATTAPAAGFTITGSPITSSGTFTFALADDLAGLEALASTGLVARTSSNVFNVRNLAFTSGNEENLGFNMTWQNSDGVSGNPSPLIFTGGVSFKVGVRAVATSNITLSGTQTIDGVALIVGEYCLVTAQTTAADNGVYTVKSGSWTRRGPENSANELDNGCIVFVREGTVNSSTLWYLTTPAPITLSSTSLSFSKFTGTGDNWGSQTVTTTGSSLTGVGTAGSPLAVATGGIGATELASTAVTPASYTNASITVDADGRITAASNGSGGSGANLAISGTTSPLTLTSDTGTDVTWTDGTGITLTGTSSNATVSMSSAFLGTPFITQTASSLLTGEQALSALSTGIVKVTTTTGVLSTAIAADFPTLNQSTTGNAATATSLATGRTIGIVTGDATSSGSSFDGTANNTNALTLATVNSNVGSFTNATLTVNAKGLVTAASNGTTPITGSGTSGKIPKYTGSNTIGDSRITDNGTDISAINSAGNTTLEIAGSGYLQLLSANQSFTLSNTTNDAVFIDNNATPNGIKYSADYSATFINESVVTKRYVDAAVAGGSGTTNLAVSGTSSPLTLTSSTGTDVTFTAGTNITLTGSGGNNITIDASGGGAPSGTANQTLYYNGTTLTATSNARNNGTEVSFGNVAPISGVELYVNGNTQTDGAIKSRGTGAVNTDGAATLQLVNTTGGTGATYHLLSKDGGTFGLYANTTELFGLDNATGFASAPFAMISPLYGTTGNTAVDLETNGVTRLNISSGASTGGKFTATDVSANTNTVEDILTLRTNSSGTAAANFGGGILFQGESTTTDNRDMVRLNSKWVTATDASRGADFTIDLGNNAGALTEMFKLSRNINTAGTLTLGSSSALVIGTSTMTTATGYTIGGSSNTLTLSSTGTSANAGLNLNATANGASNAGNIAVNFGTNFSQTSGTRDMLSLIYGFNPSSGTAVHNYVLTGGTINQTGGANGIVRGYYNNPTLTAVADYRAFETSVNTTNAKAFWATGASSISAFVGKVSFGATTTPTAQAMFAAGSTSASSAPIKFTSGSLMTTPEALSIEALTDAAYITTTTGTVRRMIVAGSTGRATAQTAANTSVATYTLGATDATYQVSANVLVTTSSAENFTATVTYTDEGNTSRTATMNFQVLAGTVGTAVNFANGAVPYIGIPLHIRCKASTAITIKTTGTFTGCTYNAEGLIIQEG